MPFRGVLFVGLMVEGDRINVIEFNVRFGDPECEPLMMRFDGDLAETLLACAEGNLAKAAVAAFAQRARSRWCSRRAAIPATIAKEFRSSASKKSKAARHRTSR